MFDGTYQKAKKNNAFLSRQKVILSLLQRWHFRFRTECGFAYWWQFHKCNYPIWSFVCILFVEFFFLRNSSLITFANFNPIWIYWNLKSTFEKNERENSRQNIQWRNSSKDWLDWQIILNSYLLQRKQHRCTTHDFPIKFRNGIYKNAFRICKICVDNVVQGVRKHTEWTLHLCDCIKIIWRFYQFGCYFPYFFFLILYYLLKMTTGCLLISFSYCLINQDYESWQTQLVLNRLLSIVELLQSFVYLNDRKF